MNFLSTSATPGFRFAFQVSQANQDSHYYWAGSNAAAAAQQDGETTLTAIVTATLASNSAFAMKITGTVLTNAGSAPTLDFQWAQNVANATATTLQRGSWLKFTPIA